MTCVEGPPQQSAHRDLQLACWELNKIQCLLVQHRSAPRAQAHWKRKEHLLQAALGDAQARVMKLTRAVTS
jgi:hypothetical protein